MGINLCCSISHKLVLAVRRNERNRTVCFEFRQTHTLNHLIGHALQRETVPDGMYSHQ